MGDKVIVKICEECMQSLEAAGCERSKYLLANDLWVGEVPFQIEQMTLPERLLVSWAYPQVLW